ncbi:MAG: exodeoxyribonuclease VII large subunit [Sporichthyaceae bacterium]
MALETSAEKPVPVRTVAHLIGQWISRLGKVWVEGQVTQLTRRPGTSTAFLALRDPIADVTIQVACPRGVLESVMPEVVDGSRVVVFGRPQYWVPKGSISFAAEEIRAVGVGDLLLRIETLRRLLASEGLFDPSRKRRLPFLPGRIGLICGRASAAEQDVVDNARRRWPAVAFEIRAVAVQGPTAVPEVVRALAELDADPSVEVIVVARGGGSVEDLLPFSDETLLRAAAACRTPVVSAIGHEQDNPLLDSVADVRASTPTDAAKLVVPDLAEQLVLIDALGHRARRAMLGRLDREQARIDGLASRPALANPRRTLETHVDAVDALAARARRSLRHRLDRANDELSHRQAQVRTLSPQATLDRGYAVVQRVDGAVLRRPAETEPGEALQVRLAGGQLLARVVTVDDVAPSRAQPPASLAEVPPHSPEDGVSDE